MSTVVARQLTTIRKSSIDGYGLFAVQSFQCSEISAAITHYITFSEAHQGTVRRAPREHLLDARVIRWINHSCRPNARIVFSGDGVAVVAERSIASGDEITCDYGATEEGAIPEPFQCNCGHCGGKWIGGNGT